MNISTNNQTIVNAILKAFAVNQTASLDVILMTNIKVITAAKFKHLNITKIASVNATLNANDVYSDNVINTALKNVDNNITKLDTILGFEAQQKTYYEHLDSCYAIVQHIEKNTLYLYVTLNSSKSVYFVNGIEASKEDVKQYLTPSAVKAMETKSIVNVSNDFSHNANVKQYKLDNVQSLQVIKTSEVIKNDNFIIA